ncbi:MAG: hypothetical protein R3B82_15390 [Sandaracinaceae bacterium]
MRATSLLLCLLLVACDDPEPAPAPEIVDTSGAPDETPDPPPSTDDDSPAQTPEPAPTVAEPTHDTTAPEEDEDAFLDDGDEDDEGRTLVFGPVRARDVDRRVRALVTDLAASLARVAYGAAARANGGIDEEDYSEEESGGCDVHWISPKLVRIDCLEHTSSRDDSSDRLASHHFVVAAGELAPIDPDTLFSSRDAIHARLRERCEHRESVDDPDDEWGDDEEIMGYGASCNSMFLVLDRTRVRGRFASVGYGPTETVYEGPSLTYDDVAALIPETGPLRSLIRGEASVPTPSSVDGIGVSHVDEPFRLLGAWQTLDDADRSRVALHPLAPGLARLVLIGDDATAAARLASAFGATPTPLDVSGPLTAFAPTLKVLREEMYLRAFADPHAPILAVLPPGAVVRQTDPRATDRYVEVDTPVGHGALGRNLLRDAPACVPRAPAGFDPPVQPLTVVAPLRRGGRAIDAVAFGGGVGGRTRVVVHELDASTCTLGAERLRYEGPGWLRDLRLTSTTPHGGESIVVVGLAPRDSGLDERDIAVRYAALRVGQPDPIWERIVMAREGRARVRVSETADDTFFPLTVVESGPGGREQLVRWTWTGEALEEAAPPTD